MARNTVSINQIVGDFILTSEGDDYTSNVSDILVRNYALRGIREIGFDISRRIQSLKLDVNTTNNTVELPDDFVDLIKVGVVGSDGKVYVFVQDSNINISQAYDENSAGNPFDTDGDGVFDRVDSKGSTVGFGSSANIDDGFDSYIFRNFIYGADEGGLYGLGGGHKLGYYRMNFDQNRIELDTDTNYSEVVVEYISDQARASNPVVHVYAEEALRAYIYYKVIERKSNVPMAEKQRARSEYYNELRKARARLSTFTKEEALQVIRRNFRQSPKV
jgi:hypothetical protein